MATPINSPTISATATASWPFLRRADQTPPDSGWASWLLLGGRGAGKTRTGAEWVAEQVRAGATRIALVAPTYHEARIVMVEGASGLLGLDTPGWRPKWLPTLRKLEWPGGAEAHIFSAEDPDGLRGPQFDAAWCDEVCAWAYPDATLSNLRMALRIGSDPRAVLTTTPRPTTFLKNLILEESLAVSRAATADNTALPASFLGNVDRLYGGTRLGRQELLGEIVDDAGGLFWPRDLLERCRTDTVPDLERIVVAVDPPVSSHAGSDACGIVVAGRAGERVYILEDASCQGLTPGAWAARVAARYHHWQADCVVAETNQGGDLVVEVLRGADAELPVRKVHASRGKAARAEPIAIQYEQGNVFHVGAFPELEDELNRFGTPAQKGSPDRADALVWAVTSLTQGRGGPAVRVL